MRHWVIWGFHSKLENKPAARHRSAGIKGGRQELNQQPLGAHAPDWNLHSNPRNSKVLNAPNRVNAVC